MKKLRLLSLGLFAVLLIVVACTADQHNEITTASQQPVYRVLYQKPADGGSTSRIGEANACGAYTIALETVTQVGNNYEWVWSVLNNNPGNGNNDTYQNNSHWGMQFGECVPWSSVVGAAYSGNGTSWTPFTPVYAVDPSQDCQTQPVLKFDFGTTGSQLSYYKLIVNQSFQPGPQSGYYKSGVRTGCCVFDFLGIGCTGPTGE